MRMVFDQSNFDSYRDQMNFNRPNKWPLTLGCRTLAPANVRRNGYVPAKLHIKILRVSPCQTFDFVVFYPKKLPELPAEHTSPALSQWAFLVPLMCRANK